MLEIEGGRRPGARFWPNEVIRSVVLSRMGEDAKRLPGGWQAGEVMAQYGRIENLTITSSGWGVGWGAFVLTSGNSSPKCVRSAIVGRVGAFQWKPTVESRG